RMSQSTAIEGTLPAFLRAGTAGEYAYGSVYPSGEEDYFKLEPRHQMTVASATAIFAPGPGGDVQLDLNTDSAADIAKRIEDVYSVATPTLPPGIADAMELGTQFTLNILDYADADNKLTPHSSGRFGLEALPFLGEVYVQRHYTATAGLPNATDPARF